MQLMTTAGQRAQVARIALLYALYATACSAQPSADVQGIGPHPVLPAPDQKLIPTVNVAPAVGWPQGSQPQAGPGMTVNAFAIGLDHPRWLYVLPNGDVLVAETNAPQRPADATGIRNRVMAFFMKKAGAGTPSANRITLLRDTDGDGVSDVRNAFLEGLHSPFGMALVGNDFYVANTDAVLRFTYRPGEQRIDKGGVKVTDLPAGPRNHHWTKGLVASVDGSTLYATVGSNSNVAEHGMAEEADRAAIWEIDRRSGNHRVFATGLRSANGLAWEPVTGVLWTTVNERDELGDDLVPDYMTAVRDGAFYGWPYSYYGQHVDTRVTPQRSDLVATAIAPDYALGAHTASLGLAHSSHTALPAQYQQGMFIGQHGSWNRRSRSGYKVIFVPFVAGQPSGLPLDVLMGFVDDDGNARGRPVGVAIDTKGTLLVADDVGNTVWRVTSAVPAP
jgi:glucose/arabinose dehydrogenase